MKKFLLYGGIGLIVIMLLFGSCSDDTDTLNEATPTVETTQNTQPSATPIATPTPAPTIELTVEPTEKPTIKPTEKPEEKTTMVWITSKGKKYHCYSGCSNMKSPYQISEQDAIDSGRGPCSKCY